MATSSGILQSFLNDTIEKKKSTLRARELLAFNKKNRGGDFLTPLNFYLGILNDADAVLFQFMTDENKKQLQYDLRVTLMLLLAEKKYEIDHQKSENKKIYDAKILRCETLLQALDPEYERLIKQSPVQAEFTDGYPTSYLGISLGHELGKQLIAWMDRKTKTIKEAMGALNEKRLYWVWGSVFLKTVLDLIPEDFFYSTQAAGAVRVPDPYTGCLSWTLYYFRFSLNLFLLLKHTIKGPWMAKEEYQNTTWTERFQTQWEQRKFTLLNDSLWGTANLLCFFWLNGKTALGAWGDALTIVLLVFDISVAVWDFAEQKAQFDKNEQQFIEDIKRIEQAIKKLGKPKDDEEDKLKQIAAYTMQLNALKRAKTKSEREWQHQKLTLITNIAYAVGLMLAFVILTMPFMPIPAAAVVALGLAGAVLCFAFTVINSAIKGGMELYKTHQTVKETRAACDEKIAMLKNDKTLTENARKLLYLEIKQLQAETDFQKQTLVLQSVHLVRTIMLETLIPAIIFASLVFLPLGVGLGALGAALGLAVASHFLINSLFKPKEKKELPPFDEREYQEFCESLARPKEVKTAVKKPHTFFVKRKDEPSSEDSDDLDASLEISS